MTLLRQAEAEVFSHADFFVLRTPLLPFDEFLRLNEGLCAPLAWREAPGELDTALQADRRSLRERLLALLKRPAICEAIYLASPDLMASLRQWEEHPDSSDRGRRNELAMVRYLGRMSHRPTPFGLLAGCSLGRIGPGTDLRICPADEYQRHTRLDMGYLVRVLDETLRNPAIRQSVRYRPNSSLYSVAGRYHFVEAEMRGVYRHFSLAAAEVTPYLVTTLERAQNGVPRAELAAALVNDEVSIEEAEAYVDELIDGQLLVADLDVAVTGAPPSEQLIEDFNEISACRLVARRLSEASATLRALDLAGLGAPIEVYEELARDLELLSVPIESNRLVQLDLLKPAPWACLGTGPVQAMLRTAEQLRRISPIEHELRSFTRAFVQRYERREVPLAEVLDEEVGIGLPLEASEGAADKGAPPLQPSRTAVLAELVFRAASIGQQEVTLSDEDFRRLAVPDPLSLPDSFAVMATIAADSSASIVKGDYDLIWHAAAGPSGAMVLGRFCYADPILHEHVKCYLQAEEALNPDVVYAEIVHLPQGRAGNILHRPILREYEIPYLGCSGIPEERQLGISDLLVSVVDDRVVLRSKRLGREVLPRMATAHHFRSALQLPVYRFLGLLQAQHTATKLYWDWGVLASVPFLPRVRYGRVVLSRATWNVRSEEMKRFKGLTGAQLYGAFQAWRAERSLPHSVVLVENDNQLPLNLESEVGIEILLHLLRSRPGGTLAERFPSPEQLCVEAPEGRFTHELVVPFIRKQLTERRSAQRRPASGVPRLSRTRIPGSDWLYVKLYTGPALIDRLLREYVCPLVRHFTNAGIVDRWFFVRYMDPHPHLRLRLHGEPAQLCAKLQPLLEHAITPLIEDSFIWRMQFDTYEREVERYGGLAGMDVAESLFHVDSEAVLRLVEQGGCTDAATTHLLAMCGIDQLLADFGLGSAQIVNMLAHTASTLPREQRKSWGAKYREQRERIAAALADPNATAASLPPGTGNILRERSRRVAPLATALRECERRGQLSQPISDLLFSYCHMHVNRLLRSIDNSGDEPMFYDFVRRYHTGVLARGRTFSDRAAQRVRHLPPHGESVPGL
jgi:thiopeptide-type bacteriocin biosynthesis protein